MKNAYNESNFQKEVISLLEKQGFSYIDSENMKQYRIDNDGFFDVQVFLLKNIIRESLIKINKNISEERINYIFNELNKLFETSNLLEANKAATKLLKEGVNYYDEKIKKSFTYKIIDFEKINNNTFFVTDELQTINLDNEKRRPDLVIYLNGFPIIVFEFKTPNDRFKILKENSIETAFKQINNYKEQVPDLFVFNFFNVISNMTESKFGSIFSSIDRYNYWRPMKEKFNQFEINQIDVFLEYLINKKTLLDLFNNYVFFTNEKNPKKIISAYHQYYGVNDSLKSIETAIKNKTGKGGIFWHTQGSGKSYSMVFLTKNFINKNPKCSVLVISDRNDLDDQTYQTFKKADKYLFQEPIRIESIDKLKENLKGLKQNGIYFSTIQKFSENKISILSNREDILIISDEAHRSHNNLNTVYSLDEEGENLTQKKGYAQVLREAFPNAIFTGFTGTPIESKDVSTKKIFGEIVSKYPMWMAQIDKFIVPIYYEIRFKHLKISKEKSIELDKYYDLLIEEIDSKANIKNIVRKNVNKDIQDIEKIILHSDRMEEIANDFIQHYKKRVDVLKGKAMFVAYNRNAGLKYYNLFVSICPELENNIEFIATSTSSDTLEMINLIGPKKNQKKLANDFKDPNSEFKIAIVVDMWLTGFDVPCLDSIYIDKPIKMHNLMQAIARVNRVYSEDKDDKKVGENIKKTSGLVIDYFGVYKYLKKALEFYNDSNNNLINEEKKADIALLKEIFDRNLSEIYEKYFKDIIKSNQIENNKVKKVKIFANEIYKKKLVNEYILDFRKIAILYNSIIQNLENSKIYKFQVYKFVYNYLINFEVNQIKNSFVNKIEKLKEMIADSFEYSRSSDVCSTINGERIELNDLLKIVNEKKIEEETKFLDAKEKELYIKLLISEISKLDKLRSEKLSKKLKILLEKYESNIILFEEFIDELSNIGKDAENGKFEDDELKLEYDELIFYKIIQPGNTITVLQNDKEKAIEIAKEAYKIFAIRINKDSRNKWYENKVLIKSIRKEIKEIMNKHNFPPEDVKHVPEFYINQIIQQYKSKED